MLKELLARANELREQAQAPSGNRQMSTIPRQQKVEMMNRMEQMRRENLQQNRQAMERMMAANQASMQVAQQQKANQKPPAPRNPNYLLPMDPNTAPKQQGQGGGLLGAAQERREPPQQGGSWQPYWYR